MTKVSSQAHSMEFFFAGGLYTPPHTPAESSGKWRILVDSGRLKNTKNFWKWWCDIMWHFYFFSGGVWRTPGGLNSESCRLRRPQYIYTYLTPKPNPNPNLNPNLNPNPNPRWWFSCWNPVDSTGLRLSKVVQKEVLGNFDVKSTGVHRSRWGSVKYCFAGSPDSSNICLCSFFLAMILTTCPFWRV